MSCGIFKIHLGSFFIRKEKKTVCDFYYILNTLLSLRIRKYLKNKNI